MFKYRMKQAKSLEELEIIYNNSIEHYGEEKPDILWVYERERMRIEEER